MKAGAGDALVSRGVRGLRGGAGAPGGLVLSTPSGVGLGGEGVPCKVITFAIHDHRVFSHFEISEGKKAVIVF